MSQRKQLVVAIFVTSIVVSLINPGSAVPMQVTPSIFSQDVKVTAAKIFDAKSLQCWKYITLHESNFNPKAVNPTSKALGIAQLLPSTMKSLGLRKSSDANMQLIQQVAYISRHFGSVCGAKTYWVKHFNY